MGRDSDLQEIARLAWEALRQLDRAELNPEHEPGSLEDLREAAVAHLAALLDADGHEIGVT